MATSRTSFIASLFDFAAAADLLSRLPRAGWIAVRGQVRRAGFVIPSSIKFGTRAGKIAFVDFLRWLAAKTAAPAAAPAPAAPAAPAPAPAAPAPAPAPAIELPTSGEIFLGCELDSIFPRHAHEFRMAMIHRGHVIQAETKLTRKTLESFARGRCVPNFPR